MATEYTLKERPLHIDIQLANAYSNLGIQRKQVGKYEEAAELHYKSLAIKERYPEDQMEFLLALSYSNLGKVRKLQGRLQDAAALFRRSVTTMKRLDQEMLSRKANFMCDAAEAEEKLGNVNGTRAEFLGAIKILKETVGEAADTGYACYRFAAFLYRQQDYDQAL
ncbi:hypothetical protein IL306_008832 [Fusarium sp. DS 682]|nr:hypothetical protein IL306_008832 [Fusarium sp. DS 682]